MKGAIIMTETRFAEIIKKDFPLLATYTPVLARVHGAGHPELDEVRDLFAEMNKKVEQDGVDQVDLTEEFNKLREITSDYQVPSDGCETYEATYQMLAKADQAYHE